MLVTRSNHDLPTTYLYHFMTEIVNFCRKKSISSVDLKGKKANKKLWQSYASKNKLSFVFISGHGDENSVCGWDDEILVGKGLA